MDQVIQFTSGENMDLYRINGQLIECCLCENNCHLKKNQAGVCGVIVNNEGEYQNLVYGYPAAIHIDPVEKKPLRHFLSGSHTFSIGTFGCNMRCMWCQNFELSQSKPKNLAASEYFSPEDIVKAALASGCSSIAYTYNEPTIFYEYARDIGKLAKENGLKNIFVSNGYQTKSVIEDMSMWVDAVNIDLKSFSPETYQNYCRAELVLVLRNLQLFVQYGIHLEISTLIIPELNDSDEELKAMANFICQKLGSNIVWHVAAFHPDYLMKELKSTAPAIVYKAQKIGLAAGLKYVYTGNV